MVSKAGGSLPRTLPRHQGPGKTNMKRKERRLEREAWENAQRKEQQERHAKEAASLKLKQDFALQREKAKLLQEYRAAKTRIRQEIIEAREKDRPEGLRRWFLAATGRLAKVEFDRQQRHAARVQAANGRLEKLKMAHRMEEKTFKRGQDIERDDLKERHAGENQQLEQAIKHHANLDQTRERQDRQPPEQSREHEQQQGRELHLGL